MHAQTRAQVRRCPPASEIAREAKLLWSYNRPSSWLLSLSEKDFNDKMEDARRQAPKIRALFRERERKIEELEAARLQKKREAAKAKEQEKIRDKMQLMTRIEELGGLWRSEAEVVEGLARVKVGRGEGKGRMLDALKSQIRFRKTVLQQTVKDPKDWTFSENAKALDVQSIVTKLVKIIDQCP